MFAHPSSKRWRDSLVEIGADDGGWTRHFRDPATDQEWTEYFPYRDDRSPSFMRHREVPADLKVLLRRCLTSRDKDEWMGVAAYVSGSYHTVEVARVLAEVAPDCSKKALKVFGRYYQAYDRRKIIGMHYTEVERSYQEHLEAVEQINTITKRG